MGMALRSYVRCGNEVIVCVTVIQWKWRLGNRTRRSEINPLRAAYVDGHHGYAYGMRVVVTENYARILYNTCARACCVCTRMISSPSRILARVRVHAFISLSLKATVNIWIIKPPPSPSSSLSSPPVTLCWDVLRLMVDEVGEERNAMEREVRRHRYNSYGTNKGDPEQRRMQEINPP